MTKRTLRDAIKASREKLIETFKENPDSWEFDGSNPYNGNHQVRVFFEKRTDDENRAQIVLEQPEFINGCNEVDIPYLLEERSVHKNMSLAPNISTMVSGMQSGKSEMLTDVLTNVMDLEGHLSTFKTKVLNNHHLSWYALEDSLMTNVTERLDLNIEKDKKVLSEIGDNIHTMRDNITDTATSVLMLNTMEDGTSPLHSSKHIINNMFTEQGMRKVINDKEHKVGFYRGFEDAINETLKTNGYQEKLSYSLLREIDKEQELTQALSSNDPMVEEMMKMMSEEAEEKSVKQSKSKKNKLR